MDVFVRLVKSAVVKHFYLRKRTPHNDFRQSESLLFPFYKVTAFIDEGEEKSQKSGKEGPWGHSYCARCPAPTVKHARAVKGTLA